MRSSQSDSGGFALVVLMVILGMTAIWMTAAFPSWKHNATREKEAELVYRGQQYVRALNLYQRKMGPGASPQSFDQLYEQKFLRKKYKDPITNDDFLPLYRSGTPQGQGQPSGGQQQPTGPGQGGALMGVQSKSTATSIMVYNGATHYNEWQFIVTAQAPGQGGPGRGPGGQPGPGGRPGAPGGPPAGVGGPGRAGGPQGPGRGPGIQPGPGRGPVPSPGPGRGRGMF